MPSESTASSVSPWSIPMDQSMSRLRKVWILFSTFFRIGTFTIGGGYAMLPLIEREFVERRKWVTQEEMIDILAIVQSLPGIIAVNSSIFIGYQVARIPGAIIATIGLIISPILIITGFAYLYINVQDADYLQGLFIGVRAGVTALILLAGIRLGSKVLTNKFSWLVAAVSLLAVWIFNIHAGLVILAAAVLGFVVFGLLKGDNR